jgi:DNA-binding response OmpR family regulator
MFIILKWSLEGDVALISIDYGDQSLRLDNHELSRGKKSVRLSLKEFEVLKNLMPLHKSADK